MTRLSVWSADPHDFELCLRVSGSFSPDRVRDLSAYRAAVRIQDEPAILELRQVQRDPASFEIGTALQKNSSEVKRIARWIIFADLNLLPFYRLASSHPVLGPITRVLFGLKPMRPPSLFEMLVIAVTEQQISMAAAYHIRTRLIERFGDRVDDLWAFPTPKRLSESSLDDLTACGLSHRKAEYVQGLARRVAGGMLNLDLLEAMSDDAVRNVLIQERGLGLWSADYFLVRGLSRPDAVPANDLGIRSVVGRHLGSGQRLSPEEAMVKLAPFKPYRGLAAFYLLAYERMSKQREVEKEA